jgi:flagellar basal-body rod protein FlgB
VDVFVSDVTGSTAIQALEKTLAFTEARNRVIAENVANITTPGYRAKQVDVAGFQAALREAAQQHAGGGEFKLPESEQLHDEDGVLRLTPSEEPPENLLFQDGTNARIERQMSALAENGLAAKTATELLRFNYEILAKAIRGRV